MLDFLLSGNFPDAEALRSQSGAATVVGGCDCACPSIALQVDVSAPVANSMTQRLVPQEGLVRPSEYDEPAGNIILFADEGRLSYLEYVYYTDTPPSAWPDPAQVDLIR